MIDLVQRSTKKVKARDVDLNQSGDAIEIRTDNVEKMVMKPKISYKESLLVAPELIRDENNVLNNSITEDGPNSEDRWYREDEDLSIKDKAFDPCLEIKVSKEEFNEWCKPWHVTFIVKILGKIIHLGTMEQLLNRDWANKGKINVIDMDRDYFLVHFAEEDYSHALLGGPWMVAGHYLIVQRWRPFFLSLEQQVKKVATWIHILNLPIELYNHHFLWRVRSTIGTILKVDKATSIHSRGRFARICVEIDLSIKLIPKISVLGNTLNIEYEGLHLICFNCGVYGHRSELCGEASVIREDHQAEVAKEKQVVFDGDAIVDSQERQEEISGD
ncbi:uncharacterized protein LOC107641164 [Arachis ipaensis]|uniref:uncharacterized protein LOC107641164 n=1 Tax=Arachis ipaensis TaxID=130454 RepID=UPI0007AFAA85|nr:uncharacterized protein LOC107641164 [Arachis ipaensis]XP_025653174.1 uncharacterized protein LOC112749121 [Arachis hypogaea]